ncbi:MAG: helix-turn-helix domain-containing protein, partial [Oscillospiraceae bacterium]|nr:helix-turn-helix domain-containing protein [Oscillospiraceae bacterium]
ACYLCTGKTPQEVQLEPFADCDFVHIADNTKTALRLAAQCLANEQHLHAAQAQLIDVLSAGKDLQHLIDEAYRLLKNPIVVVDTSYKILAMNVDIALARPDLAQQQELGYMLDANIEDMKRLHLYEKARKQHYPYYSKEESTGRGWITALAHSDGIEVAQIGVMEQQHEFGHADFELVDFLCRLVGMELQKNDFYAKNHGLMHSVLLGDLLDGLVKDETTAAVRSGQLGWHRSEKQYVLTVFDQNYGVFDRKARTVCEAVRRILPQSRWVIYDSKIVFFLPQPPDQLSTLEEYLSINHLRAGLSDEFYGLLTLRTAYSQTLYAYEFGTRLQSEQIIYSYTDFVCHHIGVLLKEQHTLRSFCHPAVLRMAQYDAQNKTELVETLREHLRYPNNPTLAAQHLFIHKNTLFYRVSKIKQLFGLDLRNGKERTRIQLTLSFLEIE